MKILVLSNLYPPHAIGGYEERCRQVIDRLRARGHQIRVLTSTHGVAGEQQDEHVHRRLRIHGFFGHPWLPIRQLYFLERHNHLVLRSEIAEFQPEVIHVWNLGGLTKSLMLTLQSGGRPVVYDVSDHWISRSLRADVWLQWWNGDTGGWPAHVIRRCLRGTGLASQVCRNAPFAPWPELTFRRIYFCSEALKLLTLAAGYPVEHAAVIHCGIDVDRFAERKSGDRFARLLYVGRLAEDKDPLTAIRAMKLLPERFSLSIYGRGDVAYSERLKQEAETLGGRVEFRAAGVEEMGEIYAAHDALLFTSAWAEPFALTPLEAMAARVPVISTLEGGSLELIRHRDNALAFKTGDAADLAAQIRCLDRDPLLRKTIASTARHEVCKNYDLDRITAEIETYLHDSCMQPIGNVISGGTR
jgi:glycogen synthase